MLFYTLSIQNRYTMYKIHSQITLKQSKITILLCRYQLHSFVNTRKSCGFVKSKGFIIFLWECTMHAPTVIHSHNTTQRIFKKYTSKKCLSIPEYLVYWWHSVIHRERINQHHNLISLLHTWLQETPAPTGSHWVISLMLNLILPLSNFWRER